jgi:hypothetical protein
VAAETANHGFNGRFMQAGIHKIGSQMAMLGTFEFVFLGLQASLLELGTVCCRECGKRCTCIGLLHNPPLR